MPLKEKPNPSTWVYNLKSFPKQIVKSFFTWSRKTSLVLQIPQYAMNVKSVSRESLKTHRNGIQESKKISTLEVIVLLLPVTDI